MVNVEKTWMEAALERRLSPVAAPDELWDRVQFPRMERPRVRSRGNAARMSACATLAVAIIVLVWQFHTSGAAVQFRSSDPAAIRTWVQANAGIDVPLHSGNLEGASVKNGRAEIAYRVGGRDLSLAVTKRYETGWKNGARLAWASGGQTYMLSCDTPEDLRACALCHLGS